MLLEAAARPVITKRPRETFIDEFEDSEAQESDGEPAGYLPCVNNRTSYLCWVSGFRQKP